MSNLRLKEDLFGPVAREFDRFFDEFFGNKSIFDSVKSDKGYPKMNHVIEGDNWVMRAAIPGVKPEDVKVEVLPEGKVRISGHMSEEYKSEDDSTHVVRELRTGKFLREFNVPNKVSGDPTATMKDGMLVLSWSLTQPEKVKPDVKVIDIASA